MKNTRITLRILAMVAIMTILAGCSTATTAVVATAVPTEIQASTVSAIMTQAANTVFANLTKNAVTDTPALPTNTLAPSGTPLPTNTPLPTSTPLPPPATATATYIPWTSTPVFTPTLTTYNCTLTDASPKTTNKITPGMDIDGQWVVKNTGSETWLHTEIDLKYVSGTKFQTISDLFDLKSDVAKNESYTVIVDMLAPATVGTYYATWTLAHGSLSFCTMNLTLVVTN